VDDAAPHGLGEEQVAEAQATLARAVARARAGEDRELTLKVKQGGEALAGTLTGLFKLTRVHAADNRAFDAPVMEFSRALGELVYLLGPVHLVTVEDQVYVNDVRARSETLSGVRELGAELARHNVGGMTFHATLDDALVRAMVAAIAEKPAPVAPRNALQQALVARGVRTVELKPRLRYLERGEDRGAARDPVEALRRAMALVEETYGNVAAGRIPNPLPLRRSVAEVLDIGPGNAAFWEALRHGLPHSSHATAVMLLTLLVGKAAGLRTGALHDLGLAALVHDVGYASVPADVAPGPEGLARHPGEGARIMLRQRGFHVAKLRRLRAVLDHHRDHAEPRGTPSREGELLRIAEDYTTLLRLYARRISPADALGAIARAAGRYYHPTIAQLMVNALGRYPPGTLLELDDGRLVRSVAPVRSRDTFDKPLVRPIDRETGAAVGDRLDLALGGAVRRVLPG
jgi:hypothetical protein